MDKKEILYNKKVKINFLVYLIFISLIVVTVYYAFNKKVYNVKEVVGLNECENNICKISITLNYEELDILKENPEIVYAKTKYKIKEVEYQEPYLNNGIPVEDLQLETDIKEEKIIRLKIYYNQQRIIDKIKENIIERK